MIPALGISLREGEGAAVFGLIAGIAAIGICAGIMLLYGKGSKKRFYAKEGLACVGLCWLVMSLLGCIPFCVSGAIPNYVDALFEMVSGFTTTGASILSDVEALPKGLLYWRSFSHWLGGMGVLVFLLAITSMGSGGDSGFTMHLLRAESPGPNVGKLVPKMRQTAGILYWIYIALTILNFIFLVLGKMPVFDAVCTTFGTAGTGGFGIKNDSMAGYSPYLQNVTTVFMLLFGINFSCYYMLLLRQFKNVFKDEELRFYLGIVLVSILVILWDIRGLYETVGEAVRHAAFQVATIITTTGFATTDFDLWPGLSKAVLLCLMIVGACAGSTGGGFKCGRLLLLLKNLRRSLRKELHPQKIEVVRLNERAVEEKVLQSLNAYLAAYAVIVFASFVLISVDGFSVATNISAVFSCFNNIGPGLEAVGPTCNFGGYSLFSKVILIFDMLAGRLEIFPVLILLSAGTWKRK